MAIRCTECGREYDVTLFSFAKTVRCECGAPVSALLPHRVPAADDDLPRPMPAPIRRAARREMAEIARGADRIASMILFGDLPDVDVDLAIERLRDRASELCPGRDRLFEMVYESRFARLREQWGK